MPVMPRHAQRHQRALGLVLGKGHLGELLRPPKPGPLGQDPVHHAPLRLQMRAQRRIARRPQPRRAVADRGPRDGGHPGGRRALARRIGEDMQEGQPAGGHQVDRVLEHRLGLGRKARDDVGAEDHVGAQPPCLLAESDGIVAQMAALHALEDHVVARLQRQVQMRHQARLGRDGQHQVLVRLDRIDRADPQPRQIRHQPQDAHDQIAQARQPRQIGPPAGQIDPGQHDLVEAAPDQPLDLLDHHARRDRPGIAAPIGDDAEGAAMIAAILDLHIGPMAPEAVDQVPRRLAHRHDVVDHDLLGISDQIGRAQRSPGRGLHLLVIADDLGHLGHGGEGLGLGLRGAARHDHRHAGIFARQAPDLLPGLAHRLGGDRAGVHHDRARQAGGLGHLAHGLGLVGVQPAAEGGEDRRAHASHAGVSTP